MKSKLAKLSKIILILYAMTLLLTSFQNCGQVDIEAVPLPSQAPPAPLTIEEKVTFLNIDNSVTDIYRATFIVDMSESMYAGACPDSIDTMIPDVNPSPNCLAPTGVDPQGNRFQVMLSWLDDLKLKIDTGLLQNSQVKILVLPYSGPNSRFSYGSIMWGTGLVNQIATPLGLRIDEGFVDVNMARNYLYFLWAIESKYHSMAYSSKIPNNIKNAVIVSSVAGAGNVNASTGTSMVADQIENMNIRLNTELNLLKSQNLLGKSHFEMVLFSDGVPKPHPVHIVEAAKYVWARKKKVCDGQVLLPVNQNCENGYNSEYGITSVDATSCFAKCGDYLQTYADTGAVSLPGSETPVCSSYYSIPYMCSGFSDGANFQERWGSKIKCGQCFKLLKQFDADGTQNYGYSYGRDIFKEKIVSIWGDWTENRHSNIISKLKTTVNVFKIQHPGAAAWKMSFVRLDSSNPLYATQTGEMKKEINWIIRAHDYFAKKHRFLVLKNAGKPFELFQELQNGQSYKLGMLYVYNRNIRVDNTGVFLQDSDGDGVADVDETFATVSNPRSDGICLDGIKKIYSQCINTGCNPAIDRDGDGLNQCEEVTAGTDDFEADTDEDGILDGSEILFALNPAVDDQTLYSNTDGYSNFEHFVKGYPALVNLRSIPIEKIISISTDLVEYKVVKDARGLNVSVPGYIVRVKYVPMLPAGETNEIVVVARVENFANPMDKRWVSKKYIINNPLTETFEIKLEELLSLDLEAP